MVLTQHHKKQAELNTTHKYARCLNHIQSKDNKFIHPPLHITNLKLSIQECNPDKDIQVDQPTIQIQNSEANIYDQRGNYMASITTERLQWLWNQFSYHHFSQSTNALQPPPQNFELEVLWLIQRYITILPKRKPKNIQPKNMHHTIHLTIIKTLIESHKITHSYYSSPLTCPTQLTQYHSPHNRDIIFGSMGHAQISRWKGIGLAYPTEHKTTVEAIHWAIMEAKEDTNTATILIINHNDWTPQQISLTTSGDIHTLATIPPHTILYNPTPEWPKYYQYVEPSLNNIMHT
jgi:hypothetical protein